VCVHTDIACDKLKGRHQQPHCRGCNPSLPPGDGNGEIMRPSSGLSVFVSVCVGVGWGVMNLLFILSLRQRRLPLPISSLIHLPGKQAGPQTTDLNNNT